MTEAERKVKVQTVIVVSCVIFAVLMAVALVMSLISLASASSRKAKLESELVLLNQQIANNQTDIDYYKTDDYIDRIAREYLNMQGQDEITFIGK